MSDKCECMLPCIDDFCAECPTPFECAEPQHIMVAAAYPWKGTAINRSQKTKGLRSFLMWGSLASRGCKTGSALIRDNLVRRPPHIISHWSGQRMQPLITDIERNQQDKRAGEVGRLAREFAETAPALRRVFDTQGRQRAGHHHC